MGTRSTGEITLLMLPTEESGRRRSRFRSEADQDSGGKPQVKLPACRNIAFGGSVLPWRLGLRSSFRFSSCNSLFRYGFIWRTDAGAFSRLLYRAGISQAAFPLRRNAATIAM